MTDWQGFSLARARQSLARSLARSRQPQRGGRSPRVQSGQEQLELSLQKLESGLIRVAVFGAVSRGKSAVLNALLGERIFATGPLNGVTQWTRSVMWQVRSPTGTMRVELIDTPGIDEIAGGERAIMAMDVAKQADLILFVVAGDLTQTEYLALCQLSELGKSLLLVFNKMDLYPQLDQAQILAQLRQLSRGERLSFRLDEIVCVAAEPNPRRVRHQRADGRVEEDWETPEPDVRALEQTLRSLLLSQGMALLALNALLQAREAERAIAQATVETRGEQAERLIRDFATYKGAIVACNPLFVLDVIGGTVADLLLVRSLARLYHLPMTSHEAGKLLRTIFISAGGLLLGETLGNALFGGAKLGLLAGGFPGFLGMAVSQGAIAASGSYLVGQAAKTYLEQGCTWGAAGSDTVLREILSQLEAQGDRPPRV